MATFLAVKKVASVSDHLGSSSIVTKSDGSIGEINEFYPFGGVAYRDDPNGVFIYNYDFTSKETDAQESGLQYFGARYLNNTWAHFISHDPISLYVANNFIHDPQQLNSYSYSRNNPLRYIDPTGMYSVETGDDGKTHLTIERGDTLSNVAQFFDVNYNELASGLGISDPNKINEGDVYDVTYLVGFGSVVIPVNAYKNAHVRIDAPRAGIGQQYNAHLIGKNGQELASQNLDGSKHHSSSPTFNDKLMKELEQNKKWQSHVKINAQKMSNDDNYRNGSSGSGSEGGSPPGDFTDPNPTNLFLLPVLGQPMPVILRLPMPSPVFLIP